MLLHVGAHRPGSRILSSELALGHTLQKKSRRLISHAKISSPDSLMHDGLIYTNNSLNSSPSLFTSGQDVLLLHTKSKTSLCPCLKYTCGFKDRKPVYLAPVISDHSVTDIVDRSSTQLFCPSPFSNMAIFHVVSITMDQILRRILQGLSSDEVSWGLFHLK